MRTLGKISFVLAPVLLFFSFFSAEALGRGHPLTAAGIVLGTLFLLLALAGKALEARGRTDKENHETEDKP